jgi:hypothetical protein
MIVLPGLGRRTAVGSRQLAEVPSGHVLRDDPRDDLVVPGLTILQPVVQVLLALVPYIPRKDLP